MSLTTQLHRGELGRWCEANLPGTDNLIADVRRRLAAAGNPAPLTPDGRIPEDHWRTVAAAFRLRLGFLVDGSAPATALLGAVRARLASRDWADRVQQAFPAPGGTPDNRWSPFRAGSRGWLDASRVDGEAAPEYEAALEEFVRRTGAYLLEHAPTGTLGTRGAETGIARSCWILAAWETGSRNRFPAALAAVLDQPGHTPEDLRRCVPETALADLVGLARLLHTSKTLRDWRGDTPGRPLREPGPLGAARPVIVPHWAEADLLVGSTLIEAKAVAQLDTAALARWLWSLLAYTWLDTQNRHEIRSVGLYLARHGVAASWGAVTFADMLLGGTGRADRGARDQFLHLARRVIAAEGAQPPADGTSRERSEPRPPYFARNGT
ncbi:hypothetical protein [Actinokineospora enzanensis]|uniref:hypothetical protein n=1 Tax=Actinokineospora enzanensis TaxID=155975 RepID=UPI0003613523|nr:hypothetical protein [Actinokineospora enzanensis]